LLVEAAASRLLDFTRMLGGDFRLGVHAVGFIGFLAELFEFCGSRRH
jgi:hypothetical protein